MGLRVTVGARRVVVLTLAVILAGSLIWGLAVAFAASPSPSPSAGKVILRVGWTSEPDNLNPFIGLSSYEIWLSTIRTCSARATTTSRRSTWRPVSHPGQRRHLGRRQNLDDPLAARCRVQDGRPLTAADVAFTYTYIIKNDMTNLTNYTQGIKTVTALDPTTVRIVCSAPKADLERALVPILPRTLGARLARGGPDELRGQVAAGRQRSLRDRQVRQGQLRRDGPQPLLVRQEAGHRPDLLRALPGPRHVQVSHNLLVERTLREVESLWPQCKLA